jgi:hypothetical protein
MRFCPPATFSPSSPQDYIEFGTAWPHGPAVNCILFIERLVHLTRFNTLFNR